MLTNLLPGLRGLRAPMAAGYVWLAFAWLTFGEAIPGPDEATGLIERIHDLASTAGRPATLAAVTFVAYLIGVLSEAVTASVLNPVATLHSAATAERDTDGLIVVSVVVLLRSLPSFGGWRWRRSMSINDWPIPVGPRGQRALRDALVERVTQSIAEAMHPVSDESRSDAFRPREIRREFDQNDRHVREAVRRELPALPARLLGTDPELYGAYDRIRVEAEFRAATSLPLAAVVAALASAQSWWWLAAIMLPLMLFSQAVRRLIAAGDLLAESVRAGRKFDTPVVDEIVADVTISLLGRRTRSREANSEEQEGERQRRNT